MLTSKEVIERTGISRATLNNYISSGLVPRPQVLPPGPDDGAAPRIGYFPDDTIERVETIQRLKQDGWSMVRIAEHFAHGSRGEAAPAARMAAPAPRTSQPPSFAGSTGLRLSPQEAGHPAYIVDGRFRITWLNEQARTGSLSPLAGQSPATSGSVFGALLAIDEDGPREALLRFHLQVARGRGVQANLLFAGLPHDQSARLANLFADAPEPDMNLVMQAHLPAAGRLPARVAYAVQFHEGVLFAFMPAAAGERVEGAPAASRRSQSAAPAAPAVTSLAILFATLQDAASLWIKLTAHEYFELVNEVGAMLDPVFHRHHGQLGRHPDEGLVCYFLPQRDGNYLWNALAAAHQAREAMQQLGRRWQARKGWAVELCMNIGVDEGEDWMGVAGPAGQADLRVLGEVSERAGQLSRCSRNGAILVTRNLFGKLPPAQRERLAYGVPRIMEPGDTARVLFTFGRLDDLASAAGVPHRLAGLAVAELLDLRLSPSSPPVAGGA